MCHKEVSNGLCRQPHDHSKCYIKFKFSSEFSYLFQSDYDQTQSVYDALQLKACNVSQDLKKKDASGSLKYKAAAIKENWLTDADVMVFVDSVQGSDGNPGTSSQPMETIEAAIRAYRCQKTSESYQGLIYLAPGTYYLNKTISLTAEDSNLVILGDGHENTFISGGKKYTFKWKTYVKRMDPFEKDISIVSGTVNKAGSSSIQAKFIGKMINVSDCQAACERDVSCFAFTWHNETHSDLPNMCYFRTDGLWVPTKDEGAISGRKVNILVADLSSQDPTPFTTLFLNGRRAVRARYPDGNPETMGLHTNPTGYVQSAVKWLPPPQSTQPLEIHIDTPQRNGTHFPQSHLFIGGPNAVFDPPKSPGVHTMNTGLQYSPNEGFASRSWKNPKTGVVHFFHSKHWGNFQYALDERDEQNNLLKWTYGGFQFGHGDAQGAEWYVENIFEELDAPGEWFYDETEKKIYLYPNGTDIPTSGIGTLLRTLFNIEGSMDNPVYNITLMNITFTQTEPTYFESYEVPSGGDWSIHRGGAVFVEGVDGFTVQKCRFDSTGGNALFLSNYIRNAIVEDSEFRYTGDSAIAAVGSVDLIDGTNGNQPRGINIAGNLVHEIGIYGKQVSAFMQALACQSEIVANVFFNGPRAGINFNDGLGGGNRVENNLIFNMVRETNDHGPFNSWDRLPYITTVKDGHTPSLDPATSTITRNFLINNYHSTWPLDHDDGSCYYEDTYNYLVYGGYKNFLGHSKTVMYNVYVYPDANIHTPTDGYSYLSKPFCANHDGASKGDLPSGWDEVWANNTCIIGNPNVYEFGTCNPTGDLKGLIPLTYNNTFYAPNKDIHIHCGNRDLTLEQFQSMGYDKGSVVNDIVDTETIIEWGKHLLNI